MLDSRAGQDGCLLVVEDDVMLRRVLVKTLQCWGYEIREASDGEAALEQIRAAGDDLRAVLLDIMLPLLDGVAVAERALLNNPKLPIVACSAALDEEMRGRLVAVGVRHFLPKPYSADALRAMLALAMEG
jgi:CheY-like chemotaxis protein